MANEKQLIDLWSVNMNEVDTSDCTDVEDILSAVISYLSELHTVDAVEVVRCKDCQSFEKKWSWNNVNTGEEECCGYCWHWDHETGMSPNQVDGDDFCSYGERRTDE